MKCPPVARAVCFGTLLAIASLSSPHATAESFRFGWNVPATVSVTTRVDKNGETSSAHYTVDAVRDDTDGITLSFRDFELESLNGEDARSAEVRARLGPFAALTATLPSIRLSADGAYLGTVGLYEMTERLLGLLPAGFDAAQRERVAEHLRSPQMRQVMQQKSGETWNIWVGAWDGLDLVAGQRLNGVTPITVLDHALEQALVVEHLGPAPETCPRCVRLRMTTVVDGPEVVQLLSGLVAELGHQNVPGHFVSARSMSVSEIVTEPDGLVPHYASSTNEVLLRNADNATHSRREFKEFRFDW